MLRLVATIMVVALAAGVASAELTAVWDSGTTEPTLAGHVYNRLTVTTDADWTQCQLLIALDSGAVYQESFFGAELTTVGPTPEQIAFSPSIEFDSYVQGAGGEVGVAGGAVDIGGAAASTFDTTGIDFAWFTTETDDIGVLMLAQATLSDDAMGTWALRVSNAAGANTVVLDGGPVENGALIPEPATMSLVVLGALAMLRRRR